jgi:hypothetical protein
MLKVIAGNEAEEQAEEGDVINQKNQEWGRIYKGKAEITDGDPKPRRGRIRLVSHFLTSKIRG